MENSSILTSLTAWSELKISNITTAEINEETSTCYIFLKHAMTDDILAVLPFLVSQNFLFPNALTIFMTRLGRYLISEFQSRKKAPY